MELTKIIKKITPLSKYKEPKQNLLILEKNKNRNYIAYIGIKHTATLNKRNIKYIRERFNDFLIKKNKKNIVIIVEGPQPEKRKLSQKELLKIYRESGILIPIAQQHNIQIKSVEPTPDELIQLVRKQGISKKSIGAWIFINYLSYQINNNASQKITTEENKKCLMDINKRLKVVKKISNIDIIYAMLIKDPFLKKILPEKYTDLWKKKINKKDLLWIQNPTLNKTAVQKVGTIMNQARDAYIAHRILGLWRKKNVFIVYGINHFVCQKTLFEK